MGISYSVDADPDTTAKAMLREREISKKDSVEIARAIKGMEAGAAVAYLEAVVAGDRSIPMKRHSDGVGHRSDIDGWDAGRYPKKAGEAFLDLLENAIGNADYQGHDGESMTIAHVAAHKVGESLGRKPRARGRATPWNATQVDVEIVLVADEPATDDEAEDDN